MLIHKKIYIEIHMNKNYLALRFSLNSPLELAYCLLNYYLKIFLIIFKQKYYLKSNLIHYKKMFNNSYRTR